MTVLPDHGDDDSESHLQKDVEKEVKEVTFKEMQGYLKQFSQNPEQLEKIKQCLEGLMGAMNKSGEVDYTQELLNPEGDLPNQNLDEIQAEWYTSNQVANR